MGGREGGREGGIEANTMNGLSWVFNFLFFPPFLLSVLTPLLSYRHEIGALTDVVHLAGALQAILRKGPSSIFHRKLGKRDVGELGDLLDEHVGGLGDVDGEGEGLLLVGVVLREAGREGGRERGCIIEKNS